MRTQYERKFNALQENVVGFDGDCFLNSFWFLAFFDTFCFRVNFGTPAMAVCLFVCYGVSGLQESPDRVGLSYNFAGRTQCTTDCSAAPCGYLGREANGWCCRQGETRIRSSRCDSCRADAVAGPRSGNCSKPVALKSGPVHSYLNHYNNGN